MAEQWLKTIESDDYEVSNLGNVKSVEREAIISRNNGEFFVRHRKERILKPQTDAEGYVHYRLYKDGKVMLRKRARPSG